MIRTRILWLSLALLLLAASITFGVHVGWTASAPLLIAGVAPDVALIGAFAGAGLLRPNRVRFYNLLHSPALALTTTAVGIALFIALESPGTLGAGLGWLLHIAVDRAAGYGLREADGSIRGVGQPHQVPATQEIVGHSV